MLHTPVGVGHGPQGFPCPHTKWFSYSAFLVRDQDIHGGGCGGDHRLRALPHCTLPNHGQHRGEHTWRSSVAVILSSLFSTKFLLTPSTGLPIPGSRNPVEIISSAFAVGWLGTCVCFGNSRLILKVYTELLGRRERTCGVTPRGVAASSEHVCIGNTWSTCCREDSRSPKRLSHFLHISGICFSKILGVVC